MEMFDKETTEERIGKNLKKSTTLSHLKEVEEYFLEKVKEYEFETSYDVMANEVPYFNTLSYTEYGHCFIMHPLNPMLRLEQMQDAANHNVQRLDFAGYFADRITLGNANKYQNREVPNVDNRKHLVVLSGSNKLKKKVCLNKLKHIAKLKDVWFKPHPLTTFTLVGELKDILGEELILHRAMDLYKLLQNAEVIHTSHMSESTLYAVALGKEVDPIDVYQGMEMNSFYHINKFLFTQNSPKEWINRAFSSPKSGIINPEIDKNWKAKVDAYLAYIDEVRSRYKDKYIPREKIEKTQ